MYSCKVSFYLYLHLTIGVAQLQSGMQNMGIHGGSAEVYFGTVVPTTTFNPERDSEMLRKAMKGIGTCRKKFDLKIDYISRS